MLIDQGDVPELSDEDALPPAESDVDDSDDDDIVRTPTPESWLNLLPLVKLIHKVQNNRLCGEDG